MNAKRKEHAPNAKRKRASKPASTPRSQPRVPGQRRSPRFTGLLADVDAAVQHEAEYYGKSVSYVLACCAIIALEIAVDPAMIYAEMRRRNTRHGLRLVRGNRS